MAPATPHTPLFAQHSRHWEQNRYVYPVISRRSKGLSIGINLNTDRICNFDCVYCCVDRTKGVSRPEIIDLAVLERELSTMLEIVTSGELWQTPPFDQTPPELRRFADIAFSGDGEPTSSPVFADACRLAAKLRSHFKADQTRIVVISNATLLNRPGVREALTFLDNHNGEVWAKLDAGNDRVYQQMVRSSIPFQQVLGGILSLGKERPIVIQSMFLNYHDLPPSPADIRDYIQRLVDLKTAGAQIRLVQVYTIARPVFQTHIAPASNSILDAITASIHKVDLPAEAYYAAT